MRNHTATHLLHAGLREVLGKHVKQAGSLVAPNHLRFDFSHFTAVEDEELQDIEDIINKEVAAQPEGGDDRGRADRRGGERVSRDGVVRGEVWRQGARGARSATSRPSFAAGRTLRRPGEIGLIKILKEGSVSSGVRRVEAITGEGSLRALPQGSSVGERGVELAASTLRKNRERMGHPRLIHCPTVKLLSPADALKAELEKKDAEIKRLTRELDQARMKSASSSTANIGEKIKEVKGVKVLAHRVDNLERAQLRTLVDQLRDKIGSGVVVLGSASNGNVALIVGVTKDLTAPGAGGKSDRPGGAESGRQRRRASGPGGGRGKDASALDAALDGAYGVVEGLLA